MVLVSSIPAYAFRSLYQPQGRAKSPGELGAAIENHYRGAVLPKIAGIQKTIAFSHEVGFLKEKITVSPTFVDLSFVEAANKRIAANP